MPEPPAAEPSLEDAALAAFPDDEGAFGLLDMVFAYAPVGLGFWDRELRFRRVNATLAAINGPAPEEHIGRTPADVLGDLGAELSGVLQGVLDSGEPVVDMPVSGETPAQPGVERHWLTSYYPVRAARGHTIGVGAVVIEVTAERHAEEERAKLLEEALIARAMAEAARVRAESALADAEEARAEVEAAHRRTQFLAHATARMTASMDYKTTLRAVARAAVPAIADSCAITMAGPDGRLDTVAVVARDPSSERLAWELLSRYAHRAGGGAGPGKVIATGEIDFLPEVTDELLAAGAQDDEHLRLLRALAPRAWLVVPLKTPVRTIGALTLVLSESGRRFSDEDVSLADALASRAALAVANARLYTERSRIARTLQQSLKPTRLPEIPGMEVAARFRPAGDQNEVGGDFYDVFPSRDGVWTALVGDVSGKGAQAAAVTSVTRHTLRAGAALSDSPAENLTLLNEVLLADNGLEGRFCTVVYARLCPAEDKALVTLANGGHPPPLVLRSSGEVERVDVPGTLLGVLPDPSFEERDVSLRPGDLLLFYTDGVIELPDTDLIVGEERLAATLRACAGASAGAVVAAVAGMAMPTHGVSARDDIAVLALKVRARTPASARA
jgi:PAS domain S-box-containing protein